MTSQENLRNNINEIKELSKSLTVKELADKYNVSYASMNNFMVKNNLRGIRKFKGKTIEDIKKMSKEMTISELAEELNATYSETKAFCNYHCLRCKRQRHKHGIKGSRNEMILYLIQKYTYESVAEVFGVTKQTIEQINKNYGVAE